MIKGLIVLLLIIFTNVITAYAQDQTPLSLTKPVPNYSNAYNPNRVILPHRYQVWVLGRTVLNRPAPGPFPGFKPKILPTYNFYRGHPGCYIACYSNQTAHSIFPASPTTFVFGQIRVPGHYQGRICQPSGYVGQDISNALFFKKLCSRYIRSCRGGRCWGNGETGAWLGIQYPVKSFSH